MSMSRSSLLEARPKIDTTWRTKDHNLVVGSNWVRSPGFGSLNILVNSKGEIYNIVVYNSIVTKKKSHTTSKNSHWVDLDIKVDEV